MVLFGLIKKRNTHQHHHHHSHHHSHHHHPHYQQYYAHPQQHHHHHLPRHRHRRIKWTSEYKSKHSSTSSRSSSSKEKRVIKTYRKVLSPFMNHVRSWSSKVMRSTIFVRNKSIRTYQLDKWIHGWRHTLNLEKLVTGKDYYTVNNSFFLVDARRRDEYL